MRKHVSSLSRYCFTLLKESPNFPSLPRVPCQKLQFRPQYSFCQKKAATEIPSQNLQIIHEENVVGEQQVDTYRTKGSISILDHLKGAKQAEDGQLYALMFTCNVCGTKAIRSFTKNAYHHGVVLVRCEGCQNVHLVADNLGWFEDEAKNLDDFSKEEVKKVQDPVAVAKFLKTALTTDTPGQKKE